MGRKSEGEVEGGEYLGIGTMWENFQVRGKRPEERERLKM